MDQYDYSSESEGDREDIYEPEWNRYDPSLDIDRSCSIHGDISNYDGPWSRKEEEPFFDDNLIEEGDDAFPMTRFYDPFTAYEGIVGSDVDGVHQFEMCVGAFGCCPLPIQLDVSKRMLRIDMQKRGEDREPSLREVFENLIPCWQVTLVERFLLRERMNFLISKFGVYIANELDRMMGLPDADAIIGSFQRVRDIHNRHRI